MLNLDISHANVYVQIHKGLQHTKPVVLHIM